jgi:hypothetical protein
MPTKQTKTAAGTMRLEQLMDYARQQERSFNDIWFYAEDPDREPFDTERVTTILGKPVPGIQAFAAHGSGSLYALWEGKIVWLDSEGDQFVIAKDAADFTDALMLYVGDIWQAARACQEDEGFVQKYSKGKHKTVAQLQEGFDAKWLAESVQLALGDKVRGEGAAAYAAWAKAHGRSVPRDIIARLVALRPDAIKLRALCS